MKNTFWKISFVNTSQESETFPNMIVSVGWAVVCVDGNVIEFESGVCNLFAPDSLVFKSLTNVTEEDVISWVKHKLGSQQVDNIEKMVSAKVDIINQNPINNDLPWAS